MNRPVDPRSWVIDRCSNVFALATIQENHATHTHTAAAVAGRRLRMSATILIVDDSKLVTDIVKMRLEMYGYQVQVAHTGEDGLNRVTDVLPDLIVLDVQMPGIDGYEVCRRLREQPALEDLPIIMLTSMDDRRAGFEAGVDDYLNKDLDLLDLPNRVKVLLGV
jgi:two-component system, OmpR family, response regulator VicR